MSEHNLMELTIRAGLATSDLSFMISITFTAIVASTIMAQANTSATTMEGTIAARADTTTARVNTIVANTAIVTLANVI